MREQAERWIDNIKLILLDQVMAFIASTATMRGLSGFLAAH